MCSTKQKNSILKNIVLINFLLILFSNEWNGNHFTAYSIDHPNAQKKENCECNGGTCVKNVCVCNEGFYGDNCEYVKCKASIPQFKQCNKGICLKHLNKKDDFKCLCNPDADGALCEIPICKDYCYNNGQCDNGLGEYNEEKKRFSISEAKLTCKCPNERFFGERCEFDKCYKELKANKCPSNCTLDSSCKCLCDQDCDRFLCHNEGACFLNNGQLSCKCKFGFAGPTCQEDICSNFCLNGGTCVRRNTTFNCQCTEGYSGPHCSYKQETSSIISIETNTLRIIIYGFTITLFVCLLSIGVYFLVQKGYLRSEKSSSPASFSRNRKFLSANFSFQKLDDTKSLTHEQEMIPI